jgi:S-adenosylmethionine hydrolase
VHVEDKSSFLTFAFVPPITLLSDFGPDSIYTGMLKGSILRRMPDAQIVDLTHSIRKFDTVHAAFVLRTSVPSFPKGTVHIVALNTVESADHPHRIVRWQDQYFIGADTGVFQLMGGRVPDVVFDMSGVQTDSDEPTFPERALFVPAATHLAKGGIPELLGRPASLVTQVKNFRPVIEDNALVGHVRHVDGRGNCITDIDRALFKEAGRGRDFFVNMRRARSDIRRIHATYVEGTPGEPVAVFNAMGLLEIAICMGGSGTGYGGATELLGLKFGDPLRIEFQSV